MKKVVLVALAVLFTFFAVSDHVWAMGKMKRGSSSSRKSFSGNTGTTSQSENSQFGDSQFSENFVFNEKFDENQSENLNEENPTDENWAGSNNSNFRSFSEEFYQDPDCERFPAEVPVPEPTTLALMGMGLGGLLLRRKKH